MESVQPGFISPYQNLSLCKNLWDAAVTSQTIDRRWYRTGLILQPSDQAGDAVITDKYLMYPGHAGSYAESVV